MTRREATETLDKCKEAIQGGIQLRVNDADPGWVQARFLEAIAGTLVVIAHTLIERQE